MFDAGASRIVPYPGPGPGSCVSRLAPCVEDRTTGRGSTDDGRVDRQRDVVERRRSCCHGRPIVEDVGADAVLGHRWTKGARIPHRRSPADGDRSHLEARSAGESVGLGEEAERSVRCWIGEKAVEPEIVVARDGRGEGGGRVRCRDADTTEPRVAFDENTNPPRPRGGVRETGQQPLVVDRHGDVGPRRERRETLELALADHVVRYEHVVDPAIDHHLGLAKLLTGDPARSQRDLPVSDRDRLVRLHVRTVHQPGVVAMGLPALEVSLQAVDVDDDGWSFDLDHAAPSLSAVLRLPERGSAGTPLTPRCGSGRPRDQDGSRSPLTGSKRCASLPCGARCTDAPRSGASRASARAVTRESAPPISAEQKT